MTTAQENIQLVTDMYDVLNSQKLDGLGKYWHDDMIWHGPASFYGDVVGLEAFKREVMLPFYEMFPDYHVHDDIQVADGDWVSATGFLTGHHRADYLGVAATGAPVRMRYSDFWLVRDGKLSENWVMVDDMGLLKQIGVEFP